MAAFLPLIQDLLPMILPTQIHITRGRDLAPPDSGTLAEPVPDAVDTRTALQPEQPAPSSEITPTTPEEREGNSNNASNNTAPEPADKNGEDGATAETRAKEEQTATLAPSASSSPAHGPEGAGNAVRGGVLRRNAIVNMTDKMCAYVLFASPKSSSPVHHNSEHDTIIYAASGRGVLATSPPDDDDDDDDEPFPPEREELEPGDFAFVPAWTEHQLINETEEQVVWVVIQGGSAPIVVNLTEWGGPEVKPEKKQQPQKQA